MKTNELIKNLIFWIGVIGKDKEISKQIKRLRSKIKQQTKQTQNEKKE